MKPASFLLALLLCVVSCSKPSSESEGQSRTKAQLRYFELALDTFAEDCGRYPTTAEGLAALLRRPGDITVARWKGPYLDRDGIPTDSWGHDYAYHCPGIRNTNRFDLYSHGPDGASKSQGNDPDDINSWDSEH